MISKNSIENLKNQLDVVDVISNYLTLKKSGANFKACCPFHGEKTPSFVISPAKQIYHCFGCGIGGDSIKFVMEYEKLSYPETIEKLASVYNIHLDYDDNQKQQNFIIIEKINEFYQKLLYKNNTAIQYLKGRGISSFSIEKFEIGYAPKSYETIEYLKSNFLNIADAKEFGIIDMGQNGLYSRFIDRITFPIYSQNNKIVGFGGRTISGHNAKYINSPQTKYFNKSRLLYGYNLAKEHIYKHKKIIITEGYLDVIMLHQAGFQHTVATLGTALTKDHIPLINKGEPSIILAYDGDSAGKNAAFKASYLLAQENLEGGVVLFEEGQDPADIVQNGDLEKLNSIFKETTPFNNFVIDFITHQYDIKQSHQKQKALDEILQFVHQLTPITQQSLRSYIAAKLSISLNLIKVANDSTHNGKTHFHLKLAQVDIAELSIIRTLIEHQEYIIKFKDILQEEIFQTHSNEFSMLLNKETQNLNAILLQEELKIYTKDELESQIMLLTIPYYNKKLQTIIHDNKIDFNTKSRLIRIIKDNINAIKTKQFSKLQTL